MRMTTIVSEAKEANVRCAEPSLIEAALNGMSIKERNPNAPLDPAEIRADALRCLDAGATLLHAHNRDIRRSGREAADEHLEAWRGIATERPETLWYPALAIAKDVPGALAQVEILREGIGILAPSFVSLSEFADHLLTRSDRESGFPINYSI